MKARRAAKACVCTASDCVVCGNKRYRSKTLCISVLSPSFSCSWYYMHIKTLITFYSVHIPRTTPSAQDKSLGCNVWTNCYR